MEQDENNRTNYLEELSGSNFEIADHQPDINGWEILDSQGSEIGEVEDLIFDSQARKVRYIVAEIEFDLADGERTDSRTVLIPIGMVDLDDDEETVVLKQGVAQQLLSLPAYESGKAISPVEELAIRYAFLGEASLPDASSVVYENHPDDFYTHGHFDDSRFIRRENKPNPDTGSED